MDISPIPVGTAIGAFLFAFPALFSIVNPVGGALIFDSVTTGKSPAEKRKMAFRIGLYSLAVLLASLWLGGYILNFFGVSLSALRIAGGLVVAARAWTLLMQPEAHEERKAHQAEPAQNAEDIAFFPLTMPLTTGPGTIAVAIALSSQRPETGFAPLGFFGGVSAAAAAISLLIWLCYRWSHGVTLLLGRGGARVMSRLVAFLLLCVGVQIIVTGVIGVGDLVEAARHK
jgi:multiple antibiotic resistance protein